jgi:hypothetical protein
MRLYPSVQRVEERIAVVALYVVFRMVFVEEETLILCVDFLLVLEILLERKTWQK